MKLPRLKKGNEKTVKSLICLLIIGRLWDFFVSISVFLKDPNYFLRHEAEYFIKATLKNPDIFNIFALIGTQMIGIILWCGVIFVLFTLNSPLKKLDALIISLMFIAIHFVAPLTWFYQPIVHLYWALLIALPLIVAIALFIRYHQMRQKASFLFLSS